MPDWPQRRSGVYLVRGDGSELALSGGGASPFGQVPKGPLRWLQAAAIATDSDRPPSDPQGLDQIPIRDPRWGLAFEFGFGGGGTDLATGSYDGRKTTLSAGDGIHVSVGLMLTPLWVGDRLGVGFTGTIGYKGSQAIISRFPLTAAIHLLPRLGRQWLLLARGGIDKELGGSFSGGGTSLDLNAKLGAFGEGGFYYIFDIWTAPEQRGAFSLTFRYTKLTYTANGGAIDGQSLMVFTTYYYNP